jgi:hypothetical protein
VGHQEQRQQAVVRRLADTKVAEAAALLAAASLAPESGKQAPKKTRAAALFDFAPEEGGDLAFRAGDQLIVTCQSELWWKGYRKGSPRQTSRAFPSNYVKAL